MLTFSGDGGSKLEAKLDKPNTVHFYCDKKSDWFLLWLRLPSLVPGLVDCWADNIKLVFNETSNKFENNAGVETRTPGIY